MVTFMGQQYILDKIRDSILNNRITCIYGMHGVGKTIVCFQIIQQYFSSKKIYIIKDFFNDICVLTHKFENAIYIFEDFDYDWLNEDMIYYICKASYNINTNFVFISRKKIMKEKLRIFEIFRMPLETIEVKQLSYKQTYYAFDNFYNLPDGCDKSFIDKIYNTTKGNPLLTNNISKIMLSNYMDSNNLDIFCKPCIVDSYGNPISETDNSIKISVSEINEQLLYQLSQNPNLLHNLSPLDFERVIAKMFEKNGFSVKLTPQTRDGGKDIFVAKNDLFSFLFYIECKKYAPDKPVGIDVIQRLYGVISAEKATGGIIATTSHFTKPAKDYILEHQLEHQITLQDYNTISDILKSLECNTQ